MLEQIDTVGILGAGSIGCYIGARLLSAGYQVRFVGRARIGAELQANGLHWSNLEGAEGHLRPEQLQFFEEAEGLRDCPVILVCTKGGGTLAAAQSLRGRIAAETVVVSMQNGVRNQSLLAQGLDGSGAIALAGMVPFNVVHRGAGSFHCGTTGQLLIEQDPAGRGALVAQLLQSAGLLAAAHRNLPGVLWGKLLLNLNNSINALANIPLLEELKQRAFRKILAALIGEGLQALRAAGIRVEAAGKLRPRLAAWALGLPDLLFFRIAATMIRIDPQARSSMWEDLQARRPTEIDLINGEIVEVARQAGASAPLNAAICRLVHKAEEHAAGSPGLSAVQLAREIGLSEVN
ncbi:MAG: 2-dehydropantoate 2-reductase [Leptospirales bacterium]|nr:2-dehydropantoate 2-reductase [Leptospirales bacterium]